MAKVGELDFQSSEPISEAHWLPCEIEHTGPAQVSKYFEVVSDEGCMVPLEAGFEGHVLEVDHSRSSLVNGEPIQEWKSIQKFSRINVFNHDVPISDTDPPLRCLEWLGVARAVAAPIDPEEVNKKLG